MRVILSGKKHTGISPAMFVEKRSCRAQVGLEEKAALGVLSYGCTFVFDSYGDKPSNVGKKALRKGGGL
jgi:hypothetical protein